MLGTIFDIQRFSVHDGPGIRTTVFMKGCPLKCPWCHNPEGLCREIQLQFFAENCIGCGRCGDRSSLEDALHCPTGALKVCGRQICSEEVLKEILKDQMFYGNDGGVTFSGGECLLQADFVAEVLTKAKEAGISTAVDTSGCVPWSSLEKVTEVCDLFLYDIKMINPQKHREIIGAENDRILHNLQKLSDLSKPVWIRIPVIPGINDSEKEMEGIADFLSTLQNIKQITLMPYHTLGKSKYETLGLLCNYHTNKKISKEQLEIFENLMRKVTLS